LSNVGRRNRIARNKKTSSNQTPPQGQEKMGATSSPEAHLQMLSEKLNLTEDQKAKLKPI
jgi:Spy/CpxP family protein refolding chaperone